MSYATLLKVPPRLPRKVTEPSCQSSACAANAGDTDAQLPDAPTACPRSLMATAAATESPGYVGRARISCVHGFQITASTSSTWGATQLGSTVAVSARPTTSPRSLTPQAPPLLPPSVGIGMVRPATQRNPRWTRFVSSQGF